MTPSPLRIEIEDRAMGLEVARRVESALVDDGLVLLPTETVYGIAARADRPAALARLAALKGYGEAARPWTWHVGSADALNAFESVLKPARRLAERYWPGPLTLVLPGVPKGLEPIANEGWTGVRLPAHRATASLLAGLPFPVTMTSANRAGEAPAARVDDIPADLIDALELILDAGPARLSEPSSVLRIGRARFELLRSGLHDIEQLRAAAGLRIGFACTGNTCRSPMAEGLARASIAKRLETTPAGIADFGYVVRSMGVFASVGSPAADHAVRATAERGVDIAKHRSSPALPEVIAELDHLYCMTQSHVDALRMILPPGKDSAVALLDPDGHDIPDPIGGSANDYRHCAESIQAGIDARLADWV
jgi:protein-tyrosine phosphatase